MIQRNLDIKYPVQEWINWPSPFWHCQRNPHMLAEEPWSPVALAEQA